MTVLTSTFVPHPLPEVDAHGLVVRSTPAPLPEGPSTVSACLETGCRDHPDRPALVWNDHTLTYSELDVRVEAAAGGLASLGIGPGDRVACSLPNRPALVEAFLATQRLGAADNPGSHGLRCAAARIPVSCRLACADAASQGC